MQPLQNSHNRRRSILSKRDTGSNFFWFSAKLTFAAARSMLKIIMSVFIRYIVMLVVALSLVGQGIAYAANPCGMMAKAEMVVHEKAGAMADMPSCSDCPHDKIKSEASNKGKTPDKPMPCCVAMVGASAFVAVNAAINFLSAPYSRRVVAFWPVSPVLPGRNTPPELDPPALLG